MPFTYELITNSKIAKEYILEFNENKNNYILYLKLTILNNKRSIMKNIFFNYKNLCFILLIIFYVKDNNDTNLGFSSSYAI